MDSENINLRVRKKKRIGSGTASCEVVRRPRLFGGSLDEYVEATSEAIPLLITSSIRFSEGNFITVVSFSCCIYYGI